MLAQSIWDGNWQTCCNTARVYAHVHVHMQAFYGEYASNPEYVAERRQVLRVRAGLRAKDYCKVTQLDRSITIYLRIFSYTI